VDAKHNRVGRLALVEDGSGAQEYFYGKMGEVEKIRRTIIIPGVDVATYTTEWKYDSWNRIQEMIYPDGEKIKYYYNLGGQLKKILGQKNYICTYIDEIKYDEYEQRSFIRYGNGTETTYKYEDGLRRLKNMTVANKEEKVFLNNTYTYDKVNNILSVVNAIDKEKALNAEIGGTTSHTYTYDDWHRLKTATGNFNSFDGSKTANYHLEMGYDNLYNIMSKKMTMTQTNLQFAGTLSAGHEFNYNYSNDNPMQLASVETKQYNVDRTNMDPNDNFDPEQELLKNLHTQDYEFDDNGNMVSVSVAKKKNEEENPEGEQEATEEKDVLKSFLWDEENRLLAVNNNGSVSCYFYDAAGERTVKLTSETEMVHVNGKKVGGNDAVTKFTAYVSPYFVVSNGGAYTKHIYAASQRIASKLGNEDGFGADPRRVEMAGGKKISDFQKGNVGERFKALGYEYSAPEKEKVEKDSTMDSEEPENLVFFYHPDHLGSTSYVTDADGNIAQHVEYIPYGEVFVEERNNSFSTNYLFNAKELDNETGLYYYGARYLDPTGAMWLSVDPMWEKYAGMSPYNYCMGNPVKMVDPDGNAPFVKNDEDGEFYAYDYDKDAFYPMGSLGYYDDRDNNKYTPGENSFLNKFRNEYRQLNDKTETGKEIVDYFRTHNCYIESYDSNANVDGYKGSHTNSTDLFTIYLDLNSCYDQRVPTLSGMFPLFTPKWLVLGHELSHVIDFQSRGSAARAVDFGGFMNSEIYATHMENRMRSEARLPLREFYDNNYPDTRLIEPLTSGIYRSVAYRDNDNSPSFYNNYNRINDRRYFMPTKYKPSF
jgi:RHS repeat-associated protein